MSRNLIIILLLAGFVSCQHKPAVPSADAPAAGRKNDTVMAEHVSPSRETLKSLHFDYAKDPACGMPLKAGLEDTAHYNGKLYGFCSKECKEAFFKDPAGYLANAK